MHGAERPTTDLDICPAWYAENLDRLTAALVDLNATLRLRPEFEPTIVRPNPDLLREFGVTLWRTSAGNVDILAGISTAPESLISFAELHARATELKLNDGALLVAGLEDLIAAKEVAGRPEDRDALLELRAIQDARRHSPGPTPHQMDRAVRASQRATRTTSPRLTSL